jgi:hypothetical protein
MGPQKRSETTLIPTAQNQRPPKRKNPRKTQRNDAPDLSPSEAGAKEYN